MKVRVERVEQQTQEEVVLCCVELNEDFRDVRDYALSKGNTITVFLEREQHQLPVHEILYMEAVGERVFVYTKEQIYEVKYRLYEMEQRMNERLFVRISKSVLMNIDCVLSIRPALNGRYLARMKNGEELMISRQYVKYVKKRIMDL